jgi:hypothetical protein
VDRVAAPQMMTIRPRQRVGVALIIASVIVLCIPTPSGRIWGTIERMAIAGGILGIVFLISNKPV